MVWAFLSLTLTAGLGVVGYVVIDDFSPFDALYQTLLTLTTVGFQELYPLSRGARIFTVFLMVFGVGIALYLLAAIATLLLEGDLYRDVEERRKRRMIERMTGHTIFVGAGRMGSRLADVAEQAGDSFVIIEHDADAAQAARDRGWTVFQGDAEQVPVLSAAGVERAGAIFVVTGEDSTNAMVTLRVREIAPELYATVRCNQPGVEQAMRTAGANDVLSPIEMVVERVAAARANRS